MNDVLQNIGELGLVPVVKIQESQKAISLGKALIAGDLPVAEITFRTDAAEEAIRALTQELPELLVGAGTVLTVDQAKKAIGAGAKFIVSPGFNPKVVDFCIEKNIPVTPGINSPTQIEMALDRGLEVVKFFPAEASGGLPLLKSMAAPYGEIRFIPTGGISQANLSAYLSFKQVHACGGTWLAKADMISFNKFDEITRLAKEAVSIIMGFQLAHLGINEVSSENAQNSAGILSDLFYFPVREGTSSVFAGGGFEIMKTPYLGDRGHVAILTNDIHRAIAYLKRKGVSTMPDTAKEKDGVPLAVYLDKEVSGFAIHLLQK